MVEEIPVPPNRINTTGQGNPYFYIEDIQEEKSVKKWRAQRWMKKQSIFPNTMVTKVTIVQLDTATKMGITPIYLSRKGDTELEGVQVIKSLDELDF